MKVAVRCEIGLLPKIFPQRLICLDPSCSYNLRTKGGSFDGEESQVMEPDGSQNGL
jgi:hypothetical protein